MLTLTRFKTSTKYHAVMGVLKDSKGGTYFTLENADKLIPCGTYTSELTWSPKFNAIRPLITSASCPESRGIRIHEGNLPTESEGCVLVGNTSNLTGCTVGQSQAALNQLIMSVSMKEDLIIQDLKY